MEEPSSGIGTPITFTVTRQSGKRGLVGLGWVANIKPSPSAAPGGDGNSTKSLNNKDVDVRSGSIYFVTNQDLSTFVIKVKLRFCLDSVAVVAFKFFFFLWHLRIYGCDY